jgi:hypothetical protein
MMEALLAGLHTAQDLNQLREATKERVIALIEAHFTTHPAPVSRVEVDALEEEHQVNLLDYPIDTRKFEAVRVVELHSVGFIYEPDYSDRGWESYSCLSLDELLDVLEVLEKECAPVAGQA